MRHSLPIILLFVTNSVYSSDISTFADLFTAQRQVAAQHLRAERKVAKEEATVTAVSEADNAAKEQAAAEAEAAAIATANAIAAAKSANLVILKQERQAAKDMNFFSVERDSYKHHVAQKFYIKPNTNSRYCLAVPAAADDGYSNGQKMFF
jgi:hypothetical protein